MLWNTNVVTWAEVSYVITTVKAVSPWMWHAYRSTKNKPEPGSCRTPWSGSSRVSEPAPSSRTAGPSCRLCSPSSPWWSNRTEPRCWTGRRSHRPTPIKRPSHRLSRSGRTAPTMRGKVRSRAAGEHRRSPRPVRGGAAASLPPSPTAPHET